MSTRPARRKAAPVCAPPPRLALEALEDRRVPAGIPALHSLPSAPVAVYLDFDGGFSSRTGVTYAPYDTDGNPGDYSAAEVAAITELHRQISVYFAMFNVDVTTVFDARPKAWHISSPTVSGGFAYVNTFPNNQPEGFNQQGDVTNRASGIAHEVGHIFGLGHVRDYDLLGNEINEYSSGFDALHGPLMGVDFAGSIHKFVIARSGSVTAFQDDIAVIAADLDNYGGDGFRPDDFGNTTGAATAVSFGQTVTGIIERLNDADAFSFTTGGGPVRVRATRVAPSGVDLKVQVFNSAGALIAEADPFTGTGTAANNVDITLQLAAGTYFALVSSHGDYGDVGTYTFNVSTGTAVSPPTFNGLSPPTGVALVLAATGTGITVSWNAVAGASGYTVRRSEDGVTYTTAGTTSGTSFTDNGPSASRRWFYQVQANSGSTVSTPSAAANIVNRPAAPFNLTVTRVSGGTTVALNWRDVAGDTGYRIERSTDGTNWTQVGTVGRNVPGFTNTGLNASTTYLYRVFATSPQGDSRASAVAATNNALAVHTTSVTGTSVSLRWSPVVRSRYDIERSTDGVNFTLLATQTGTTYTDSTVTGGVTYTYRVKAEDTSNGSDNSPPSVLTVAIGGVSNAPPVLTPPANQTVPSTQATVTVPLAASDPDGDPVTFAATAVSLAHRLDVTLGYNFFSDGNFFQNFLGRNERWVQTALVPAGWVFVEPDGRLFAWDGGTSGALVGNVGAYYYADPTRLVNVPTTPFATLAVSGSTLTVTRTPAATASSIYVTVTASDGRGGTDTEAFTVTVTAGGASNAPPVLTPPANQTVPSTQATVTVPLAASDPDGDPVTFAATAVSLAHRLDVTLGYNFFSDGNFFQNFLGRNERWVQTALVPAGWAFVEPDGELFAWDGGTSGALVGNVGAHYYADPTRLVNVPTTPFATLAVSGSTLTLTRTPAATASSIYVTVTASDGRGGSDAESFTVTVATAAPQAPAGYAAPDGGGKPSSGRFPDDPSGAGNRPSVGAATEEIGGEDVTLVLDGTDGGDSAVADDGAADEVLWGGPGLDLYPGCMCSVCCRQ